MAKGIQVTIAIDSDRAAALQKAFPGQKIEEAGDKLALIAVNEFIDLLARRKRYLSLSHQSACYVVEKSSERIRSATEFVTVQI